MKSFCWIFGQQWKFLSITSGAYYIKVVAIASLTYIFQFFAEWEVIAKTYWFFLSTFILIRIVIAHKPNLYNSNYIIVVFEITIARFVCSSKKTCIFVGKGLKKIFIRGIASVILALFLNSFSFLLIMMFGTWP